MKVGELQQHLSKLDPNLEILCHREDESLQKKHRLFQILDIESVNITDAEKVRLDDGTPYLKLGKGPASVVLVILEVTSDF